MKRRQTAMLAAFVAAGGGLGVLATLRGQETLPAGGGEKSAGDSSPAPKMIQKTYDVRDLLVPVPNQTHVKSVLPVTESNESVYSPAPSPSFYNGHLLVPKEYQTEYSWQDTPERCAPEQIKGLLTHAILAAVDPSSWVSNAPDIGLARDPLYLRGSMVITQTPQAHEKIAELLRQFRESLTRQFVVQGWWVQADEKDLSALLAGGKADPRQVNPDALKAAKVLYRGRVVCYDEQRTYVASGREYSAVLGLNPTVSEGASEITPDVRVVHAGMILETQVQLSDDGKTAQLGLWSIIGRPRGPVVPVDRKSLTQIDSDGQCFRTALAVPLGVPILTGGGTYGDDGKGMYLVVQVDCVGK
ncbi:MAG: hypothetical protein NTV86_23455 [Planctomycetota bacterium]|nr:hypothetical protein [Planctomycetota bacterium]